MTRIDGLLVCVGAQQAGANWLLRTLSRHPDIFVPPLIDLHYLDHRAGLTDHLAPRKRRSRARKFHQRVWTQWHRAEELRPQRAWWRAYAGGEADAAWYERVLSLRDGRRYAAEATPEYAIAGREALGHLLDIAPDVRIVLLLRNPVARAWAQLLHQCHARGEEAARLGPDALLALADEPRFGRLSDYTAMLTDLDAVFPAGQLHCAFSEDLRTEPARTVAEICRFLGARSDPRLFPELGRRLSADAPDVTMPPALRRTLTERHAAMMAAIRARMGRLPASWEREIAMAGAADPTPAR